MTTFRRSAFAAMVAGGALAFPALAAAHVSVHPNVVPAGAFTTLTLQVPNEGDTDTTAIAVRMPPGFLDVSAAPPPGWKFSEKTEKLAKPVRTDDGELDSQVSEIDFTGGRLPPGQFGEFRIAVAIPGKAGDVLTFKTVQTYAGGKSVRWIGPPSDEQPAPWIDVSAKGGQIEDVAGGEAGPPASAGRARATPAQPPARVIEKSSASNGLAISALIVALLAGGLAGFALAGRRRAAVR